MEITVSESLLDALQEPQILFTFQAISPGWLMPTVMHLTCNPWFPRHQSWRRWQGHATKQFTFLFKRTVARTNPRFVIPKMCNPYRQSEKMQTSPPFKISFLSLCSMNLCMCMCSQCEGGDVNAPKPWGLNRLWVRLSTSQTQRVVVGFFVRTTDEPVPRLPRLGWKEPEFLNKGERIDASSPFSLFELFVWDDHVKTKYYSW